MIRNSRNWKTIQEFGSGIRMHGNGFVQIDMAAGVRLHIWPADLDLNADRVPRASAPIHDHTFGFVSWVLTGRMLNIGYDVTRNVNGCYQIHEAVKHTEGSEDTKLVPVPHGRVDIERKFVQLLEAGCQYTCPPFEFHETAPLRGTVVTLMRKTALVPDARACVLVRGMTSPDNDFDRYQVPESELWDFVEEACIMLAREGVDLQRALGEIDLL